MFAVKLLANTAVVCIVTLFWTCSAFSHFTFFKPLETFYYKWSQMKAVKLCYFMLNSNEPIKVAYFQKLANQSMLNGAFV